MLYLNVFGQNSQFNLKKCLQDMHYKNFTIVIYDRNVIGQYYKTTIVAKASPS